MTNIVNTELLESNDNSKEHNEEELLEFLTFVINEENYGISIQMVSEIKCWSKPTRLPNTPHFVIGVLNLRGIIVPVFDLKAKFGMQHTEIVNKNAIIFISHNDRTIGILVDSVSDIIKVKESTIKSAPQMEGDMRQEFLYGLIDFEERMVALLDMEQLLKQLDLSSNASYSKKAGQP